MTPILYILFTAMGIGFITFGWGGEGYLSQICLIVGGLYFGFILTEALNYTGE
jgi:hypothetical protein